MKEKKICLGWKSVLTDPYEITGINGYMHFCLYHSNIQEWGQEEGRCLSLGGQAQNPRSPGQKQPLSLTAKNQDLRGIEALQTLMN